MTACGPVGVPWLHVVTDDRVLADGRFLERAGEVLRAGGEHVALHVRGPETSGARAYELTRSLVRASSETGGLVLVNDRVDVVLVSAAHGAHLGARSLPVRVARELLGDDRLVGASVHDPAGAARAGRDGADFAFVGTVWETPSHPERPGGGVALVRAATEAAGVPVLAIGGVGPERVPEVLAAGGYGVAVVRGVWASAAPAEAVGRYLAALQDGYRRRGDGSSGTSKRRREIE